MTDFVDELPGQGYFRTKDGGKYSGFVADLKANPGKWGVMPYRGKAEAGGVAGNVRQGTYVDFRDGNYQVASRNGLIYVRYMGEKSS